jgi:hypothetical protein
MRRIGIVMSLTVLSLTSLHAQQNRTFPAGQQISLLITQAERAFDSYESALELERELMGGTESAAKDKETLTMARNVLTTLKKDPSKGFNSPMAFLLVTNLDDASRNMAVCMGQGGMQAATEIQEGKTSSAMSKLHISRACGDSSTLLYTVSESALDLYAQYLSTQYDLTQKQLRPCRGVPVS